MQRLCLVLSAVCSTLGSILCLLVGILGIQDLEKYTPLYEDVVCDIGDPSVTDARLAPSIRVGLHINVRCKNPNPYDMAVSSNYDNRLYLGQPREDYGQVFYEKKNLPAAGESKPSMSSLLMSAMIDVSPLQALSAGRIFGAPTIPFYFDLNLDIAIAPTLLLVTPDPVSTPVRSKCGALLQLLPTARIGEVVCGDDADALELPALGPESETTLEFEEDLKPELSDDMLKDAEGARDGVCYSLITLGFVCFAALLVLAGFTGRRLLLPASKADPVVQAKFTHPVPVNIGAAASGGVGA